MGGCYCIMFLFFIYTTQNVAASWGQWSTCSKACNYGTQSRSRNDSTGREEKEEQYCNTQYCPEDMMCNDDYDCKGLFRRCIDKMCQCERCNLNKINCFLEYGNCTIRKDPPTAIGFTDPFTSSRSFDLESCTTSDNLKYELHVISIHSNVFSVNNTYEVVIRPRGPVTKPIVLVLTSIEIKHWKINTPVYLSKVWYSGPEVELSTAEKTPTSRCDITAIKRPDLPYHYGSMPCTETKDLLTRLMEEFGPITSLTEYFALKSSATPRIELQIGGNPLAVLPKNLTYDDSLLSCTTLPTEISSDQPLSWGSWSTCSTTCDFGTQRRSRLGGSGIVELEEQYCNTQYCPVDKTCHGQYDCLHVATHVLPSCVNGICKCLEDHSTNCFNEFGNCTIRKNSPTAIGYRDPSSAHELIYDLNSCTSNDNSELELHVFEINTNTLDNIEISVKPRGPITKPIILVLANSDRSTHWKIDTPVHLHKVLYTDNYRNNSTVEKSSSSRCDVTAIRRTDLLHYFRDIEAFLTQLIMEFGPITSFTEYYFSSNSSPRIILNIGGNPLAVLPREYKYDDSFLSCESLVTTSPL